MTVYPPALDAHDRAVWDRRIAAHTSCIWTYGRHRDRPVTVKRCWCGAEELAPAVSACPVRVTATVVESLPRALPTHPLALPAAPSAPAWPAYVARAAEETA